MLAPPKNRSHKFPKSVTFKDFLAQPCFAGGFPVNAKYKNRKPVNERSQILEVTMVPEPRMLLESLLPDPTAILGTGVLEYLVLLGWRVLLGPLLL
jgi:hypothetical protein